MAIHFMVKDHGIGQNEL